MKTFKVRTIGRINPIVVFSCNFKNITMCNLLQHKLNKLCFNSHVYKVENYSLFKQ